MKKCNLYDLYYKSTRPRLIKLSIGKYYSLYNYIEESINDYELSDFAQKIVPHHLYKYISSSYYIFSSLRYNKYYEDEYEFTPGIIKGLTKLAIYQLYGGNNEKE